MKAIILAAGYATRLYPLTKDRPKALLPIGGAPIIDYIVKEICTVPVVDSIYVVSNNKFFSRFEQWVANSSFAVPVKAINDGTDTEETRRGAIGDILFTIQAEAIDDELLIIAGDNFFTFKMKDCYNFYKSKGGNVVVAKKIDDVNMLRQFAVAVVDDNDKVVELVEKPQNPPSTTAIFATYFYNKETAQLIKQYIDQGNKPDAPGYFVQWLYKMRDVYAYAMDGDCYDIGTLESYEDVKRRFPG